MRLLGQLINAQHFAYLLALKFEIAPWDNLYIFPLLYFLNLVFVE